MGGSQPHGREPAKNRPTGVRVCCTCGGAHHVWETTVGAQKAGNIHLSASTKRDAFIKLRNDRDAKLSMPRLIIPAIQVNIRAGKLPQPEDNGIAYLKVPLNAL